MLSSNKEPQLLEAELENPHVIPTEVKELDKAKGHVILEGYPCKITNIYKVRSGFKGSKTQIIGSDIFTNKQYAQSFSNIGKVNVPIIKRTDYSLIGIEGSFASLMDGEGNLREDVRLPSSREQGDLTEKIINAFEANQNVVLTVMSACGQEMIVDLKEDP